MTNEEAAKGPVKCALLPDGGSTGCCFDQTEKSPAFDPALPTSYTVGFCRFTLDHGCCEKTSLVNNPS